MVPTGNASAQTMREVRVRKLLRRHLVDSSQIGPGLTQLSQLRYFDL